MSEAETLLAERLHANLTLALSRVARNAGVINLEAVEDISSRAVASGDFRLSSTGRLETFSGESPTDWCRRLVVQAPFYGAPVTALRPVRRKVDLSKATAAERLEFANEALARGDGK